ncbi:MAG: hypothetical protein H7840_06010 [Alphaproteobacteria bacterium]
MPRVATLVSHQILAERMMTVQKRVQDQQVQLTTGKRSRDYAGIATRSLELVNFTNQTREAKQYMTGNATANLRLSTELTAVSSIEKVIRKFRTDVITFSNLDFSNPTPDKLSEVREMQEKAFNAMNDIEDMLNTRIEGRFLFAGGKTDTRPVTLPYSSLTALQTAFPGTGANFPVTRDKHLGNTSMTAADYGTLDFAVGGTITANPSITSAGSDLTVNGTNGTLTFTIAGVATAGAFGTAAAPTPPIGASFTTSAGLNAGTTFTVTGNDGTNLTVSPTPQTETLLAATTPTVVPNVFEHLPIGTEFSVSGGLNSGTTFTITGNTGTVLTVTPVPVAEVGTAAVTISATTPNSFYQGDQLQLQHRIDEDRTISLGINAADGGFEKAIRAMGMIAQGDAATNTAAVMAAFPGRVQAVLKMLNDSLEHDPTGMAAENTGDIRNLQNTIGRNQVVLSDADDRHTEFMSFLSTRIIEIENVNPLETAATLNSDITALDISMKVLARVQQLSLSDYI